MSTFPGWPATPTTYSAGAPSPFDIAAISGQIDRAAASLKADERGSLTIQIDEAGAGGGLIVKGPTVGTFRTRALATITFPKAQRYSWSTSLQVSFLTSEAPKPVRVAPQLRGLYRLFRKRGSSPVAAAVWALAVTRGLEVRIGG